MLNFIFNVFKAPNASLSIIFFTLAQIVDGRLIFVEVAKTEKPGEDATSQ